MVDESGITIDLQKDLRHHGGPDLPLVLYSLERFLSLQIAGHSVYPGRMVENPLIAGLDWDMLSPGTRLSIGEVMVEITGYAIPCSKIKDSYMNEDFYGVGGKKNPGWGRFTLRVLQPGRISVAEPVTVASES